MDAGPPRPADHAQGSQIESVEAAGEPFCDVTRTHQQNPLADQRLGGPAQPQFSIWLRMKVGSSRSTASSPATTPTVNPRFISPSFSA